jgi:hypothetical protein
MFRRKQEDDPFAALNAAAERGSTRLTSGALGDESPSAAAAFGEPEKRPRSEQRRGQSGASSTTLRSTAATGTGPVGVPRDEARRAKPHSALFVFLLLVLALGGGALAITVSERDMPATSDAAAVPGTAHGRASGPGARADARDGASGNAAAPAAGQPVAPSAAKPADFTTPAGFRRALAIARGRLRPGEHVNLLRLARDRVDLTTRLRNGRQRMLDVDADGSVLVNDAGFASTRDYLKLGGIDVAAPQRAVRAAAARGRFPASKLDYLVLLTPIVPGQPVTWEAYFRGVAPRDSHWTADVHGRGPYRPGLDPTPGRSHVTDSLSITANGHTVELTGAQAERVSACIQRAGADAAKIDACLP